MPQPKAKKVKKEKEAPAEPSPDGAKKGKKKKAKATDLPPMPQWLPVSDLSVKEALSTTTNWSNLQNIQHKYSSGIISTATHFNKSTTFNQLNPDF